MDVLWIALAAAAVSLWLVAAADLIRRRDAPGMFRAGWAVLLLVLPVAGPVIYLWGGRRGLCVGRDRGGAPRSRPRP